MLKEPPRATSELLQTRPRSPAASTSSASSRPSSHIRPAPANAGAASYASQKATELFVRRVLCPQHASSHDPTPIAALLPPLSSSNAVDLQLYAIIAVIIKDFVYSWYSRFTSDHAFVEAIVHIIAHCTRALEERARTTNVEQLVLQDIPALFDVHVKAYRTVLATCGSSSSAEANAIYHALRPHPALESAAASSGSSVEGTSPDSSFHSYCHILAQSVLAVLLPTEDLQNPALFALVSEIAADLVLGMFVGRRMCEPLFIYDSMRKAAAVAQPRLGFESWAADSTQEEPDRLSRFGLLSTRRKSVANDLGRMSFSDLVNMLLQYSIVVSTGLWTIGVALVQSWHLPSRRTTQAGSNGQAASSAPVDSPAVVAHGVWAVLSDYVLLPLRMPGLAAAVSLADHYVLSRPDNLGIGGHDGLIDRILAHHVLRPIFPISQHMPAILLNLRLALFPNDTFGTFPSSEPPSPLSTAATRASQTAKSKRAAAFAILCCIPQPLARLYFAPQLARADEVPTEHREGAEHEAAREALGRRDVEVMVADIEDTVLDVFSNEHMNRHLMLGVVERLVVAFLPELGRDEGVGRGLAELLADRGVGLDLVQAEL